MWAYASAIMLGLSEKAQEAADEDAEWEETEEELYEDEEVEDIDADADEDSVESGERTQIKKEL